MNHEEHLRFGVDYGTGTVIVAAQWIRQNLSIHDSPIDYLQLRPHQEAEIEQTAVWAGHSDVDDEVVYGRMDVAQWRQKNPKNEDRLIELAKLGLHQDFQGSPAVVRLYKVLGSRQGDLGSLQEFITYHLRCIRSDAIKAYRKIFTDAHATEIPDFESLPSQWYIAVPSLATERANGVMLSAARDAGMGRVNLVEEPLCAAVTAITLVHEKGRLREGDRFEVFDIGRGTSDIATVQYLGVSDGEQHLKLQRIGISDGNHGGSQMINERAWEYIRSCYEVRKEGGLETTCHRLGIPEAAFYQIVSNQVEGIKLQFPGEPKYFMTISGCHGDFMDADALSHLQIIIPWLEVEKWYKTWLAANVELASRHIRRGRDKSNARSTAILTGGGSRSLWLRDHISAFLHDTFGIPVQAFQILYACPTGALKQYYFKKGELPREANFYVTMDELWNPEDHPDATTWVTNLSVAGRKAVPKDGVVVRSKYNSDRWVRSRLIPILRYTPGEGFGSARAIVMDFMIDSDMLGRLELPVYWSKEWFDEHSASLDEHGNPRAGLHSYPINFADIPDLSQHGFKLKEDGGTSHYQIQVLVTMVGDEDSLKLTVRLMRSGYTRRSNRKLIECFADGTLVNWTPTDEKAVIMTKTREVWHKERSHFPRGNATDDGGPRGTKRALQEVDGASDARDLHM